MMMEPDQQMGESSYYAQRARQHLDLAGEAATVEARIAHLNLASRYATLRDLAERATPKK